MISFFFLSSFPLSVNIQLTIFFLEKGNETQFVFLRKMQLVFLYNICELSCIYLHLSHYYDRSDPFGQL
jgi:hypothetical protein